ncbi:uracil-DNA glycosylase [Litorimonas cladophorae]|nr:uracil-DNA glycosylase [Litorimonas cladophorae]
MMTDINAPYGCRKCPRLARFLDAQRIALPGYFNGPVPNFYSPDPKLLIVGLAPGLHGANQTGRPFTGDAAGDLLYAALEKYGFSTGTYDKHKNDGLQLNSAMITNVVRCVPPQNKPVAAEINTCRDNYHTPQLQALPNLKVMLCLGKISHDSTLRSLGMRLATHKFGHGTEYVDDLGRTILSSYHCSRYNTNTNRLTEPMFFEIFARAREICDG